MDEKASPLATLIFHLAGSAGSNFVVATVVKIVRPRDMILSSANACQLALQSESWYPERSDSMSFQRD